MAKSNYSEKLRDPRWQKKRLEILQRDEFTCQRCGDTTTMLAIHHKYYLPRTEPWEYSDDALLTLCEFCHSHETEDRPGTEADLILIFKRLPFLVEDLHDIGQGFLNLSGHNPIKDRITLAQAFKWFLSSPSEIAAMVNRYETQREENGESKEH